MTRANYLASPPLVVAYALAGRIDIDFETEPIGYDQNNNPVFLNEIWPTMKQVREIENEFVTGKMFLKCYGNI